MRRKHAAMPWQCCGGRVRRAATSPVKQEGPAARSTRGEPHRTIGVSLRGRHLSEQVLALTHFPVRHPLGSPYGSPLKSRKPEVGSRKSEAGIRFRLHTSAFILQPSSYFLRRFSIASAPMASRPSVAGSGVCSGGVAAKAFISIWRSPQPIRSLLSRSLPPTTEV